MDCTEHKLHVGDVVRLRSAPNIDVFNELVRWATLGKDSGGGGVPSGSVGIIISYDWSGSRRLYRVVFACGESRKVEELLSLISRVDS